MHPLNESVNKRVGHPLLCDVSFLSASAVRGPSDAADIFTPALMSPRKNGGQGEGAQTSFARLQPEN